MPEPAPTRDALAHLAELNARFHRLGLASTPSSATVRKPVGRPKPELQRPLAAGTPLAPSPTRPS